MDTIRHRKILAYLKKRKSCTIPEIMEKFGISQATAYRDIYTLSRSDAVERVKGGAVYNETTRTFQETSGFMDRIITHRAAKTAAAQKAVPLVKEGDIVFIDSSTTTYEFALLLLQQHLDHLTIITNALAAMNLFRKFPPYWTMIGIGGCYDPQLNSILGLSAVEQLSQVNITKAFISCFGVDDKTATTNHERQAEFLRKVLDIADRRYLIADHTKIGRKGLYRIAPRGAFDAILTD